MRIAAGGMGEVWAAEHGNDAGFRELVAVKTIRPDLASHPQLRAMFVDESRLAARVRDPNVIEVLDFGAEGSTLYQVMRFVEGLSVATWIEERAGAPLPVGVACRLVVDLLRGLDAVHALGVAHRDVSPQNVVVGIDGIARLTDFGIAKPFGESLKENGTARGSSDAFERIAEETEPNGIRGKLGYLAPELFVPKPADARSDLYAAGVVLWEALTGRKLFAVADDVVPPCRGDVPDVCAVAPAVPRALAEIVERALEADPGARFQTAPEMIAALELAVDASGIDAAHDHVAAVFARDLGARVESQRAVIADIAATARTFHGYEIAPRQVSGAS